MTFPAENREKYEFVATEQRFQECTDQKQEKCEFKRSKKQILIINSTTGIGVYLFPVSYQKYHLFKLKLGYEKVNILLYKLKFNWP